MNKHPMTLQGATALKEELERLKKDERPRITKAIAEARAHGDLKENAEYHAARDQQGLVEARVRDIEAKLSNAQVIDVTKIDNQGKVIFGSTVVLTKVEDDEPLKYHIVGEDEAHIQAGKISITSPIARALIGKEEGDIVVVKTPNGMIEYTVDAVKYV